MRLFKRCSRCERIRLCDVHPDQEEVVCDECRGLDRGLMTREGRG
jgi:hypothetical protein